jgi:hypothetical protein
MFITGSLRIVFEFGLVFGQVLISKKKINNFWPFGTKLTNLNTNPKYLLKKIQIQTTTNLNNQIQTNPKPKHYKSK